LAKGDITRIGVFWTHILGKGRL